VAIERRTNLSNFALADATKPRRIFSSKACGTPPLRNASRSPRTDSSPMFLHTTTLPDRCDYAMQIKVYANLKTIIVTLR